MDTIVEALSLVAKEYAVSEIDENATIVDALKDLAGGIAFGSSNVTVAAPTGSTDFWGTKASDMQSSIAVANGAITGTLKKLTSGQLVTDWGEGYFLALKFTKNNARITDIKVGMDPSMSSGLVSLDDDMLGVFKVTDKDSQRFEMICTDGSVSYTQFFDLSGLTLSE